MSKNTGQLQLIAISSSDDEDDSQMKLPFKGNVACNANNKTAISSLHFKNAGLQLTITSAQSSNPSSSQMKNKSANNLSNSLKEKKSLDGSRDTLSKHFPSMPPIFDTFLSAENRNCDKRYLKGKRTGANSILLQSNDVKTRIESPQGSSTPINNAEKTNCAKYAMERNKQRKPVTIYNPNPSVTYIRNATVCVQNSSNVNSSIKNLASNAKSSQASNICQDKLHDLMKAGLSITQVKSPALHTVTSSTNRCLTNNPVSVISQKDRIDPKRKLLPICLPHSATGTVKNSIVPTKSINNNLFATACASPTTLNPKIVYINNNRQAIYSKPIHDAKMVPTVKRNEQTVSSYFKKNNHSVNALAGEKMSSLSNTLTKRSGTVACKSQVSSVRTVSNTKKADNSMNIHKVVNVTQPGSSLINAITIRPGTIHCKSQVRTVSNTKKADSSMNMHKVVNVTQPGSFTLHELSTSTASPRSDVKRTYSVSSKNLKTNIEETIERIKKAAKSSPLPSGCGVEKFSSSSKSPINLKRSDVIVKKIVENSSSKNNRNLFNHKIINSDNPNKSTSSSLSISTVPLRSNSDISNTSIKQLKSTMNKKVAESRCSSSKEDHNPSTIRKLMNNNVSRETENSSIQISEVKTIKRSNQVTPSNSRSNPTVSSSNPEILRKASIKAAEEKSAGHSKTPIIVLETGTKRNLENQQNLSSTDSGQPLNKKSKLNVQTDHKSPEIQKKYNKVSKYMGNTIKKDAQSKKVSEWKFNEISVPKIIPLPWKESFSVLRKENDPLCASDHKGTKDVEEISKVAWEHERDNLQLYVTKNPPVLGSNDNFKEFDRPTSIASKTMKKCPEISDFPQEKRAKIIEHNSSKDYSMPLPDVYPTHDKDTDKILVSSDNNENFDQLLEFCRSRMKATAEEEETIFRKLKQCLKNADPKYIESEEFKAKVLATRKKIEDDSNKLFVYLRELQIELRAYKRKNNKNAPQIAGNDDVSVQNLQSAVEMNNQTDGASTSAQAVLEPVPGCSYSTNGTELNSRSSRDREKDRQIAKLEKLLEKYDRKIKRLQSKELSLDDLYSTESAYIQEERFKKKMMKIWEVLCQAKQRSTALGRETERKFTYQGTRYDPVNKAVEKFINKKKLFPDYTDILKLISDINKESDLGLLPSRIPELAQTVFQDVGLLLKKRRERDHEKLFGCYLTDEINFDEDPANTDENLRKTLNESAVTGLKKIDEIMEKYVEQQYQQNDPEENPESSHSDDDNSERPKSVNDNHSGVELVDGFCGK